VLLAFGGSYCVDVSFPHATNNFIDDRIFPCDFIANPQESPINWTVSSIMFTYFCRNLSKQPAKSLAQMDKIGVTRIARTCGKVPQ